MEHRHGQPYPHVVIAAVTMMVGLVVVANMESSMPDISALRSRHR
jgi:hypothetical protein